jgi:DNA polymerase-1
MSPKRLYIVDAMALAYRSFFAFGRTPLSTSSGEPTAAIYGTAMFMNKFITEEKPDHLVVVTDSPKPSFRKDLYKEYKAQRDRMPDDLTRQLPTIFELFEAYGARAHKLEGYEADDLIGSICKKYASQDLLTFIVSGDKDFMQLINDYTFMYSPKRNEPAIIVDQDKVFEKFLCKPEQVIDCLALIGDTSDNVPGVMGIGEKGAAKLIETYGDLETIYKNLDKIKAKKQRETLEASREIAFLSRDLVTIKTDIPIEIQLDAPFDWKAAVTNNEVLDLYDRLEFRQLASKSRELVERKTKAVSTKAKKDALAPPQDDPSERDYIELSDPKDLEQWIKQAKDVPFSLAWQADTNELVSAKPIAFGLCRKNGEAIYFKYSEKMKPALTTLATKPIVGHGLKFLCQLLNNIGLKQPNLSFDTKIADYLIDPNNNNHGFDASVVRHLGIMRTLDSDIPEACPNDVYLTCEAADLTMSLHEMLSRKLSDLDMDHVLNTIEMPLIPILAQMEQVGMYVDADVLVDFSSELDKIAKKVKAQIYKEVGREFNINSPKQLQEVLFEDLAIHKELGIKRLKRTKTGYSTDESVLSQLSGHPVPKMILEFRSVTKLKNTYVDSLPQHINPKTNRLHTSFRQTVAATGRLSSDNPNLQNIPMRTEMGRKIRRAFVAQKKDYVLISADYSQVEIRLLAHLANSKTLIDAFVAGMDIHTATAAKIFNLDPKDVDSDRRSQAKAINFGIIYGMGPQRLARETSVTLGEAKEFIARYFEVIPEIKTYTEHLITRARTCGYSVTMTGRRRPVIGINDSNRGIMARAENIAVNAPIQGSAADLIKLAMINIEKKLSASKLKGRMLLQIHDELLFESPKSEVDELTPIIRDCMENAFTTKVPLVVDIGSGPTWLDAH